MVACDGAGGGTAGCPEPFLLHEDLRRGIETGSSLADVVGAVAGDQRDIASAGSLRRLGDMRDHGQAGDLMQHLRLGALHARALARGEDDRQAASLGHGRKTVGEESRSATIYRRYHPAMRLNSGEVVEPPTLNQRVGRY